MQNVGSKICNTLWYALSKNLKLKIYISKWLRYSTNFRGNSAMHCKNWQKFFINKTPGSKKHNLWIFHKYRIFFLSIGGLKAIPFFFSHLFSATRPQPTQRATTPSRPPTQLLTTTAATATTALTAWRSGGAGGTTGSATDRGRLWPCSSRTIIQHPTREGRKREC